VGWGLGSGCLQVFVEKVVKERCFELLVVRGCRWTMLGYV
jgi:hypothetical protein